MPRIMKIRVVTTTDMEILVGDEYASGPLSPAQRKVMRDRIEKEAREQAKQQQNVKIVDVAVKRAFVSNG